MDILWKVIGPFVTALAVLVAVWRLSRDNTWRRRRYAVDMLGQWNRHTAEHRRAIEEAIPGILELEGERSQATLSPERAREIYLCKHEKEEDCELNSHVIELLNYCEFVSISYTKNVAEAAVIEGSFKNALIVWHEALQPYMEVTRRYRGYNPWQPFSDLVAKWGGKNGLARIQPPPQRKEAVHA